MSIISGVTIYPLQHSNFLTTKATVHPSAQPECCFLAFWVQFTSLLPPGIIQPVWGCTSAVYREMFFSSNLPLWLLCSCSCTALAHSQQGAKDQCPPGPQLPTGKHSRGSWSSAEDNSQFANSSLPCVYHATEFWLFFS